MPRAVRRLDLEAAFWLPRLRPEAAFWLPRLRPEAACWLPRRKTSIKARGLVTRYWIKNLGGAAKVGRYVSLGTPQYGTYVANIIAFLGLGSCLGIPACQQMSIGSSFVNQLNAGDDTPGSVRYITVRTLQDELVRPVDNAELNDGARNILVQG